MDSKQVNVKVPVKRLDGQMAGQVLANQQFRSFRSKSKDKLKNGKNGCTVHKNKYCSKVPRIVRVPSKSNLNKGTVRLEGKQDDSGDNRAGPSKLPNTLLKKNITPGKLKPSYIPRRKVNVKENTIKEPSINKDYQFLGDSINSRNVQRIQLLINQDFRPEERVPAASIACTRPIPTLGQIYTHNNVIDTDRLDADWFVELDTPANSMASNFFNISSRLGNARANAQNDVTATNKYRATAVTNLEFDGVGFQQNAYRSTDEDISNWLSSDIEYPTRDNESGYRSLSPPTHTPMDIKSKHSKCSFTSGREISENNDQNISESSTKTSMQDLTNESTATTLKEQPTVVLAQITPALVNRETDEYSNLGGEKHEKIPETDHSKNYQYPSRTACVPAPVQVSQPQVTVPSYVECPSEILQKTTNFEGDDMVPVACDSPKTLSSNACTEMEFHDDLSSQYILEREGCVMDDHCTLEWCHQCRSCKRDEKSNDSENTSVADSLIYQYNDDLVDASLINAPDDQYAHHCRWRRHYDAIRHCKKCQRYSRFPSTRYKLPKTLSSLRRRMSLRICRRRLSRVWKKTTEKWAMWSAKSPHKLRKLRVMHYLQRSIQWEDVDVQTNVFIYREIGTEPTLKEQKSAAVSAILKFGSSSMCNRNVPGTSASPSYNSPSKFRHINLGPSMFPFYNSKKRSLSQQKFRDKRNSIGKENDVYNLRPKVESNEIKKMENHVITQTLSCFYSQDINDVKQNDNKSGVPINESENYIEICEVSMDDKHTGTEDMTSPMKDNVTSTLLDLDALRQMNNWEYQNANTQMCIVCNNAETDIKFPSTRDNHAANVVTSMREESFFQRPYGTNTDLKNLRSMNVMTSTELLKSSPTFNHIETQVTPVQSLKKISTGILTSKSFLENKSARIDMSTGMNDDMENKFKDFTNQVMPQRPSFMSSVTKSTSTSAVTLQEAYAVTSRKEFDCAGVLTTKAQVKSGVCLTSPSLQQCQCAQLGISSRGTETSISKHDTTSTNKLKTYLNTGMLINTLVEGALMQSEVNPSSRIDTKSIGNKYTSEIATCTDSAVWKGSVIEKEKDRYPKRLSVDTNSYLEHQSRSTEHGADWTASVLLQKIDNATQYSFIDQKGTVSCRSERIGHSRLISVRTLSHLADETGAQTEPVHIDAGALFVPQQYKCTSVFTSQCALDQPMIPATVLPKDFGHINNGLSSSPMINRRKSSSNRNSSFRMKTSAVLSSDLDADTWIKSCIEKGYQSQLEVERSSEEKRTSASDSCGSKSPDDKRSDSKSVGSETHSEGQRVAINVTTVASAITDKAVEKYDKINACEKQIVKMVDNVTSDEVVRKEVKEITLQASPENCEAATECSQAVEQKSACVFTSRCILPTPSPCSCHMQNCGSITGDCLFVYGKPRCVVHSNEECSDASVQMSFTRNFPEFCTLSSQMPSNPMRQQPHLRSVGMLTSYCAMTSYHQHADNNIAQILTPKVYEALYETTKKISEEESQFQVMKNLCSSYGVDAEVEANLFGTSEMRSASVLTSPDVRSAAVITSQCGYRNTIPQSDQFTQREPIPTFPSWSKSSFLQPKREDGSMQTSCDNQHARLLEIPTHDNDPDCIEQCVKTHLVTSCRYYSSLLTKQLDRVRENLTKHLTPSTRSNYTYQVPNVYTEACTMKPSAREEFGCQTFKNRPCYRGSKFTTTLSPAVSLTDICRHDKEHLKSVYFMLSAIEGRLRRFKTNIE